MTPAEVIGLFRDPETLLRHCYLVIAGDAYRTPDNPQYPKPPRNGQAPTATFQVEVGDKAVKGFTTGLSGLFHRTKKRVYVRITMLDGAAKDDLAKNEFNAYYIPMVQTSDVKKKRSLYTLPTGDDALDLMVTSQLSGCMFGVGSDAKGAKLVSHVQPDSAIDADERQKDLVSKATDQFKTVTGGFRRGPDYDHYAAVIGRRTQTRWTFYLQAVNYLNPKYMIGGVKTAY